MFNRFTTTRGGFLTLSVFLTLLTVVFVACGSSATSTAVPQAVAEPAAVPQEPAAVPEEAAMADEDKFKGESLNVLIWTSWATPELIKPFEEKYSVKVNVKEYEVTTSAVALLRAEDPGFYDLIVVDTAGVDLFVANEFFEPLDMSKFDVSDWFQPLLEPELTSVDGTPYVIPGKFGYNALSYNTELVDAEDVKSYAALWDPKYAGKTGTYAWSVVSFQNLALYLGYDDFAAIDDAQLAEIAALLQKIKDNGFKVAGDVATLQQALANESAWLLWSTAEFAVSGLMKDGFPVDWTIPDEGALMWSEAIGIGKDTKKRELAELMINYYLSPEAQHKLSVNPVYWAMPANRAAGVLNSAEENRILRWDDQDDFLANAVPYWQPPSEVELEWEDLFYSILTD